MRSVRYCSTQFTKISSKKTSRTSELLQGFTNTTTTIALSSGSWGVPSTQSCTMAYTDSCPARLLQRYHGGCRSGKACLLYKQVSLVASKCLLAQELLLLGARVESTGTPAASATPTKCTTEVHVTGFKFLASLPYRSKNPFGICCVFTGPSIFKMVVQGTSSCS